jgi:nitroimidazol reductase NimA-like FMN-containing flavoprotein (pyridoxamine 5'-phosphate oxidase superfamily)
VRRRPFTDPDLVPSMLQTMTRDECLAALRAHRVGRVSVTHQALPVIVPVNYAVEGNSVIFRTRSDGFLAAACHSNMIAFEIDDLSDDGSAGWSVLVVGVADALDEPETLRATTLGLASAAGDDRDHFIGVSIGQLTGRRVGLSAA